MDFNQDHRTLLQCNSTEIDSAANATTIATHSILKLNEDFTAMMLSINRIAHGVVPKISSVKDAVKKKASTYATAAATGTMDLGATITTSKSRDSPSILIIENADRSYKNSADIKRSFAEFFPKKKLLFAYRTSRENPHLEFASVDESKAIESEWQQNFLGSETTCRRPRMSQKNHSVLMKELPKAEEFTDVKLTTLLEEIFPGAKARRFIKKDKSVLNIVKIDFPRKKNRKKHCPKDSS